MFARRTASEKRKTWPADLSQGQAKAEYTAWLTPIEERIALLRASVTQKPSPLTQRQCRALAGEWYNKQVARFEEDPGSAADWWVARQEVEPEGPSEREAGRIKPTAWLVSERDALLQERSLRLTPAAAENLLQEMGDLWLALCSLMERRSEGDYGPDPLAGTLPVFEAAPAASAPVVSISQLFEDFAATGTATPHTVSKWRRAVESFVQHLGHDDATAATRADAVAWFDKLLAGGLAVQTVRATYRAALARVFKFAHDRARLTENVFARLEVTGRKQVQTARKGLSDEEAKTILTAALKEQPKGLSETHARARRWVPWICAYTGARVNEITQLRAMDIRQVDGVWVFHITPEAGSVKTRKARSVPIHSHLIEQGITALAQEGSATPLFYQPDAARKGSKNHPLHTQMGGKLGQWVRGLGVTEVQSPNHGWRHRFKTQARRFGVSLEAQEAIQGHAPRTEGQAYGEWPMDALKAELEKLDRYEAAAV